MAKADGTIVGCERVTEKWPEEQGPTFTRHGDRVRIDVRGKFGAVSISACVRLDASPGRRQSLLLPTAAIPVACIGRLDQRGSCGSARDSRPDAGLSRSDMAFRRLLRAADRRMDE